MLTAVLALTAATVLAPTPASTADWLAGFEHGYMTLCAVSPAERALWPAPEAVAIVDLDAFVAGIDTAFGEAAAYERAGFDLIEWCADFRP